MPTNDNNSVFERIILSRSKMLPQKAESGKAVEEGGCGVTGFISSIPVSGRHIYKPSVQMHNRGNGKGGGIAAVGLIPEMLGVTQEVLDTHYLLHVALLDPEAGPLIDQGCIEPYLDIYHAATIPTVDDFRDIEGLEVKPPDVRRYFVRVKPDVLERFIEDNKLNGLEIQKAEDEFIYQNTYRLNQRFYTSLGEKKAFVLSHGRNIMILKIVGYAEQVTQYYLLDDFKAHGWIAHQRYPTKGRVWHPGGAHPFIGMDEALVHNGDFANYHSITEYLRQYKIAPQFLTDTEVSVLLFDLLNRNFEYPLEYIIEAMAPTTEHDFSRLPPNKQYIYRYIQQSHIHGSPDGPWFFIITRNDHHNKQYQLIGITDTAMLRPQVFAIQEGQEQIGFICSEKQAIDATLQSLAEEYSCFCPIADDYWYARGGSATDGGAFIFTVKDSSNGDNSKELTCTNKFGEIIRTNRDQYHCPIFVNRIPTNISHEPINPRELLANPTEIKMTFSRDMEEWDYHTLRYYCQQLVENAASNDEAKAASIEILTFMNDSRIPTGEKKRSSVLNIVRNCLNKVFAATPALDEPSSSSYRYTDWKTRSYLRPPRDNERALIVNTRGFPPEGDDCDARLVVKAYQMGWKQFILYGYQGQRFCGCGLGEKSDGVRIDVFDSSGDYLGSGIDGADIYVHGNAQDQLGQIMKRGKLVVFGDVGQTFMYGAKGGQAYVLGNAAGRPLINAVGRPRVVINGTCLDYLAESFMAGDPLNGGGFVIMNAVSFDKSSQMISLDQPYPGSNLFSLASGGAVYLRDPFNQVVSEQLNGGEFAGLTPGDWELIHPYLKENEALFGIRVDDLLTVNGTKKEFNRVYRKVQAKRLDLLAGKPVLHPSPEDYAGLIAEGEDADE